MAHICGQNQQAVAAKNCTILPHTNHLPCDAGTALFGTGGSEDVILHIEVQESSSVSRITRRVAKDELAALKQNSRLAMFDL